MRILLFLLLSGKTFSLSLCKINFKLLLLLFVTLKKYPIHRPAEGDFVKKEKNRTFSDVIKRKT